MDIIYFLMAHQMVGLEAKWSATAVHQMQNWMCNNKNKVLIINKLLHIFWNAT